MLLWGILAFDASISDVTQFRDVSTGENNHSTSPQLNPSNVQQLELQHLLGYGSAKVAVWSPDGQILAVGGAHGIWLFDATDWTVEPRLLSDDRGWVQELTFNPDGNLLFAVDLDGDISLWDVETETRLDQFGLTGDKFGIKAMGFTPSGRVVVATSNGRYVALRDFHTGYPIWVRRANAGNVRRLRFTENGHYLISEGEAPDTVIWDVESATAIARFEVQYGVLMTVDGQLVDPFVAGMTGNRPMFYSADDSTVRQIFPFVGSSGFATIDQRLRHVVYYDPFAGTIVVFDIQANQELLRFSAADLVMETLQISEDGRWLTVGHKDGAIEVWDLQIGANRQLTGHEQAVTQLAIDPTGQQLVSLSTDGSLRIWTLAGMALDAQFPFTEALFAVTLSPDGEHIYAAGGTGEFGLEASVYNQIWVWNAVSGDLEMVTQHYQDRVTSLQFHPSDGRLAIGTLNGTVEIVLENELVPTTLRNDFRVVNDLDFAPSGELMAVAGIGVELWSLNGSDSEQTMNRLTTPALVNAVAFNDEGSLIAAAHADLVTVWEIESGKSFKELYVLNRHRGEINAVAFQPNGSLLATGSVDGTVRLWDMNSGEEIHRLQGDFPPTVPAAIYDVIFSMDGRLVIAGAGGHRQSEDAIWIWDAETGELLTSLEGQYGGIYGIAMSDDGTTLVSASWDGTVGVWKIDED